MAAVRHDVPAGGRHSVSEVRAVPGELSFDVEIAGVTRTVWLRTDAPVTPTADAALAASLMPAMRAGGTLAIDASISRRLLRTQAEYQAIQRIWSHDWLFGLPALAEVDVEAPATTAGEPDGGRGVATFFSGGVDSWATVLANPEVTHLVFVRGMDIALDATDLGDEVEARLRVAAREIDLPLYVVETNLREFSDLLIPWGAYYGGALAATALLLAPLFERVLMTGDLDYEVIVGQGAHPLTDHLWSTERLEVVHATARHSRLERLRLILDHPVVQGTLRVCWENQGGAYNCGRCRKCLMTMATLEALGALDRVATFGPLELPRIDGITLTEPLQIPMWEELRELARERGRADIERAVDGVLARSDGAFELPESYRRRRTIAARVGPATVLRTAQDRQAQELAARLDTVVGSRSWKLTRPLRALARRVRERRGG